MPVVKIKILEKTCWQKKSCWQTKDNVNMIMMAEWMISTLKQPVHTSVYVWSSTVWACSYRHYLMKNNTAWTISAPTTNPCEVQLFELASVIGTTLSAMKNNTRHWQTWKTFLFWEKSFHMKMKIRKWNRKSKYKLPIITEK